MITRLILLSDGTGNSDAALWRTNVWRLLDYIDQSGGHQLVYYDKGIGTASSIFSRIFGRAFGFGLPLNVLSLYKFLCQNYRKGETEIFAFGFSRGAYAIRAVLELILSQGLVASDVSDVKMNRNVEAAYRAYKAKHFRSAFRVEFIFRAVRDFFISVRHGKYDSTKNIEINDIAFVGLWDTVGAYGFPIEGIAKRISQLIWPFQLSTGEGSPKIRRVCHALSVDDDRRSFYPIMWDEGREHPAMVAHQIRQVWFPGEHSNLGGGNPDDSLAQISLYWMMQEAERCGLVFKRRANMIDKMVETRDAQNTEGRIHNSRQGLGSFYRYAPRNISAFYAQGQTAKIHESVFRRIHGRQRYAPLGIPRKYDLVTQDAKIVPADDCALETPAQAAAREVAQEQVWNRVWLRRLIYYLTIAAWVHLLLFPVFHSSLSDPNQSWLPPVTTMVMLLGAFVPSGLDVWVKAYAGNPGWLLTAVGTLVLLNSLGPRLETTIKDKMRAIWWGTYNRDSSLPHSLLTYLRTGAAVQRLNYWTQEIVVTAFTIMVVSVGLFIALALLNAAVFDIRDANGQFCRKSSSVRILASGESAIEELRTSDFCKSTGIGVERGERYSLRFVATDQWRDGEEIVSFGGIRARDLPWYSRAIRSYTSFLKRIYVRPSFTIVARIGERGLDQNFIDPDPDGPGVPTIGVEELLHVRRDGELFLYINDAVLAIPGWEDVFYRNNGGGAKVTIKRIN